MGIVIYDLLEYWLISKAMNAECEAAEEEFGLDPEELDEELDGLGTGHT